MALDIYKKGQHSNILFSISEDLYDYLAEFAIIEFNSKTGILIDNYGDTRLTPQHSELLLQILRAKIPENKDSISKEFGFFTEFLVEAINKDIYLELVGD